MLLEGRPGDAFEESERELIRREVDAFLRGRWFRFGDADDLEQECSLAWWRQRPRFEISRASMPTFLKRVVRSCLKDFAKGEHAKSREGARAALSLNKPMAADSDIEFGDTLSARDAGTTDLRLGIDFAIGRMTQRQRAIVRGTREGCSRTEIARANGISRDTLYAELDRIRAGFRDEGLHG